MGRDKLSLVGERVVRIGVTGHREMHAPDEVARVVDRTIDDLVAAFGADTSLVVVSALAEGADRLVAERVLDRPGAELEVILPLAVDEYAHDFHTPASLAEFQALLGRAASVRVVPSDTATPARKRTKPPGWPCSIAPTWSWPSGTVRSREVGAAPPRWCRSPAIVAAAWWSSR